jgi:hypothetical protein
MKIADDGFGILTDQKLNAGGREFFHKSPFLRRKSRVWKLNRDRDARAARQQQLCRRVPRPRQPADQNLAARKIGVFHQNSPLAAM